MFKPWQRQFEQADLHDPIEYERTARRVRTPEGPVLKISFRRRDYWTVMRDRQAVARA